MLNKNNELGNKNFSMQILFGFNKSILKPKKGLILLTSIRIGNLRDKRQKFH